MFVTLIFKVPRSFPTTHSKAVSLSDIFFVCQWFYMCSLFCHCSVAFSFFECFRKAVLRDCGRFWVYSFIFMQFLRFCSSSYIAL